MRRSVIQTQVVKVGVPDIKVFAKVGYLYGLTEVTYNEKLGEVTFVFTFINELEG